MNKHLTYKNATQLRPGQSGMVVAFADPIIEQRLVSMGVLPGTRLGMVRTAPLGGAYYFKRGNCGLALRAEEAQSVLIE